MLTNSGKFQVLLIFMCCMDTINGGKQSMKVVDEPSNFGMNVGGYQAAGPEEKKLVMRVAPSNFSGPSHLQLLKGHCYSLTDSTYKYEFCPFSNLTQYEQSLRWNPYSGILGIWQEWEISDNTFVAMVMREGDSCGAITRTVKVLLKCGNKTAVTNVTEPSKCQYQLVFETPLVCHQHSLLVYPTLSQKLRTEWDVLEGQYINEEFTRQGYETKLHNIFEKAGLVLPKTRIEEIAKEAKIKEEARHKIEEGDFQSLETCSQEFKRLKEQVDSLKTLLEVNGINPDTGKRDGAIDPNVDPNYYNQPHDYYHNRYDGA